MSSRFDSVLEKVRTHLQSTITSAHSGVPVFGPNRIVDPKVTTSYVKWHVTLGRPVQINVSPVQWRYPAILDVAIGVPQGSGDKLSRLISDTLSTAFSGQVLTDALGTELRFEGTSGPRPGTETETVSEFIVSHDFHYDL